MDFPFLSFYSFEVKHLTWLTSQGGTSTMEEQPLRSLIYKGSMFYCSNLPNNYHVVNHIMCSTKDHARKNRIKLFRSNFLPYITTEDKILACGHKLSLLGCSLFTAIEPSKLNQKYRKVNHERKFFDVAFVLSITEWSCQETRAKVRTAAHSERECRHFLFLEEA